MTPLQRLVERCRRKQDERDRELGFTEWGSDADPLSLDHDFMEGERMYPLGVESWQGIPRELTTIYHDVSDFIMTLRASASEVPWASAEEALEEWRSRTLEDWGFSCWHDASL